MDWMPGGDWGFKQQVDDGNLLAPWNLALPAAEVRERSRVAEARRTSLMEGAVQSHQSYWDQKSPAGRFEHWRFAEGVSCTLRTLDIANVVSGISAGTTQGLSSVLDRTAY